MSTNPSKQQILSAKDEAEASLADARSLYDKWLVANGSNPTNLTQKEADHLTRTLKNRLLSLKWDCEDLEELVVAGEKSLSKNTTSGNNATQELDEARKLMQDCRSQLTVISNHLEDFEANKKLFNKHGIQMTSIELNSREDNNGELSKEVLNNISKDKIAQSVNSNVVTSIIENPLESHFVDRELLINNNREQKKTGVTSNEIEHFDKSRIERSATIFDNALYDHYEGVNKGIVDASKVFGNLGRPQTSNVYVDSTNENEMILEMLETEYYNPPEGLLGKTSLMTTRYNQAIRARLPVEMLAQNKLLAAIPLCIIIVLLLVI